MSIHLRQPFDFHPHQKPERHSQCDFDEMPFFASSTANAQYLNAPPAAPSRKRSQHFPRSRDDIDEFLSSDLELSFASTMSLHSPPHRTSALTPDNERADFMDISPPPNPAFALAPSQEKDENTLKTKNRPRAFTSAARTFGRDMSSSALNVPPLPKSGGSQSGSKHMQRAALPFDWLATAPSSKVPDNTNFAKVRWANP
jgi:M-phase inducer tyrosine phosphatase